MKKQLLLTRMLLLVALLAGSVSVWATDITYTFTSKSWAATAGGSAANWTSGSDGNSMQGAGVQVTAATSGANATSPESFSNISQIVVTYSTNASKGTGSIAFKVGSNTAKSQNVTTSGGTTDRTLTYNFNPVETGSVLMTVTCTQNSIYIKSVRITYSTGPSISASDKDIAYDATSGEFSYTLNNPVDGGELSATDDVDWISDVVVNTGTNKVTFNTEANNNPTPRVGTITMTYKKGNETLATKEVTITQAKAVVMLNYSLATQVVPGRHYIITSGKNGSIKAMGAQTANNRSSVDVSAVTNTISISSDTGVYEFVIAGDVTTGYYTIYDIENAGYLYAASSSNNYLRNKGELDANGKWTIDIDNNGVATIKAKGDYTHNWIRNNGGIFSCYTGGQADIYLFERDGDTSIQEFPVTITEAGYASYSNPFALNLTGVEGLTAYKATTTDGSSVTLKDVIGIVPAETGLLLKGAANTYSIPVSVETPTANVTGNLLQSTAKAEYTVTGLESGTAYVFGKLVDEVGFFKAAAGKKIGVGKSWLLVPGTGAKDVEFLSFVFGDEEQGETDGIKAVSTKVEDGVRYNLAGQKVGADYKGIVIVNGKKYLRK